MTLRPAKTQISLGIRPIWSESSLSAVRMKRAWVLSYPLIAPRRLMVLYRGSYSDSRRHLCHIEHELSLVTRKPVVRVCDQVRHKPDCAAKEARWRLGISDIETRKMMLSRQRTTKALIRLRGCTVWSAPLLFAYGKAGFLMTWLNYTRTTGFINMPLVSCMRYFLSFSLPFGVGSWLRHFLDISCNVLELPVVLHLVGLCRTAKYANDRGFHPHVQQHYFVEIGQETISTAILSLPLIQEGQLPVTGERMCTKYWLSAWEACPGTVWIDYM